MTVQRQVFAGILLLVAGAATPAGAQTAPTPVSDLRALDLAVHAGVFRAGSDEGAIGTGPTYGVGLTVPAWKRLALEVDLQSVSITKDRQWVEGGWRYHARRTFLVPTILYRFGSDSLHGFVGGGVGLEFENDTYRQPGALPLSGQAWREIEPGLFELRQRDTHRTIMFKGGLSVLLWRNIGLRGDVFVLGWHLGARTGVIYRFD